MVPARCSSAECGVCRASSKRRGAAARGGIRTAPHSRPSIAGQGGGRALAAPCRLSVGPKRRFFKCGVCEVMCRVNCPALARSPTDAGEPGCIDRPLSVQVPAQLSATVASVPELLSTARHAVAGCPGAPASMAGSEGRGRGQHFMYEPSLSRHSMRQGIQLCTAAVRPPHAVSILGHASTLADAFSVPPSRGTFGCAAG